MRRILFILMLLIQGSCFALVSNEVLVIVNSDMPESVELGEYYIQKRAIPAANILKLSLGSELGSDISRDDYNTKVVGPIREKLAELSPDGNVIKCLVTTYGVPYRVGKRRTSVGDLESLEKVKEIREETISKLKGQFATLKSLSSSTTGNVSVPNNLNQIVQQMQNEIKKTLSEIKAMEAGSARRSKLRAFTDIYEAFYGLQGKQATSSQMPEMALSMSELDKLKMHQIKLQQAVQDNWDLKTRIAADYFGSAVIVTGLGNTALALDAQVSMFEGKETNAALDSELSLVMFGDYELYRWQVNEIKQRLFMIGLKTLMVSRLDGPSPEIARGLIDKAIAAEKTGLKGVAYFDARGYSGNKSKGQFEEYDASILLAAETLKMKGWKVVTENTESLFADGECPDAALYCGWYSLRKYIPSFTFVDGAVGYHIASFEAIDLRSPGSGQWVPNLLENGITATIGAVAEPYLGAFPTPADFFSQLLSGKDLVEAYYKTNPYNSWMMMLIGDPLYTPMPLKR